MFRLLLLLVVKAVEVCLRNVSSFIGWLCLFVFVLCLVARFSGLSIVDWPFGIL